ncbi:MAG TPA: phage major capsid protein [Myxococcota bacterium]|nr:phage major capsid protein [Myxococcota bacterium]
MTSPNANFGELLSTTIQMLEEGGLYDNILTKNATSAAVPKRTVDGGPTIVVPVIWAENGSYKRYSGDEPLNTTSNDTMTSFQYPWCQVALNIQANGREILQNAGRSQYRDLLKSRVKIAKLSFENSFNEDMLSDGSAPNQIGGWQLIASDNGTGTVGGIARASYDFAKNQFYRCTTDGGAAMSAANIVAYMDRLDLLIAGKRGNTKVILADNTSFGYYEGNVHALQRITNENGKMAKLGFKTYGYKQAEVVFEPTISGMPTATQYWIDPDCVDLVAHSQRNLVQLPRRESFNQDSFISYLAWMGNLVVNNYSRLGVLNND